MSQIAVLEKKCVYRCPIKPYRLVYCCLHIDVYMCVPQTDYYYQYTQCDSTGSRWRVAIPLSPGSCSDLPPPIRGTDCSFSCPAGKFLDMSTQECTPCDTGSYSLGSGIRFDQWDTIPAGFVSQAFYLDPGPGGDGPGSSWTPQGVYLESNRDECTVSLFYAVHLEKQGSVSFTYQYPDNTIFFEFFVQSEQCQEVVRTDELMWKISNNGEWATHTVNLKPGTNILYWRTTGILAKVKPVLLKNIQIEGVAYTSECFPCRPGWYSEAPGSSSCQPCPSNTFSVKGASSCTPCPENHYSHEGWAECKVKPPCSEEDYFQIHTACDSEGKTQILYHWVEPKICLENVTGAVELPATGQREPCPPCNPGYYNSNDSTCSPCPPGTHSDGTYVCRDCPAGTEPVLGYEYKWWNVLPSNMKTYCFNVGNSKCNSMNGWEVAGDHIQSGAGSSDNDYLILSLHVPGFKVPVSLSGMTDGEFGRITFEFETICSADCELFFMMVCNSTTVVESWEGSKEKQSFSHTMTRNTSVTFTWAFQRTNRAQDVKTPTAAWSAHLTLTWQDVTHTARMPVLHVDLEQITFLNAVLSLQCNVIKMEMSGVTRETDGHTLFICLHLLQGKRAAICRNNITEVTDTAKDGQSDSSRFVTSVEAFICQSTIIPTDGRGLRLAISSLSMTLADIFLGATADTVLDGVKAKLDLFPKASNQVPDINFFYRSMQPTGSCENGRSSIITLRCNPDKSGQGELTLPSACPEGTCDGCTFHFLWESSSACPLCTEDDYHQIEEACKGGDQETIYMWNEPKVCTKGVSLPPSSSTHCVSVELWLKVGVGIGAFVAALLISLTCYFWKKNQRLEYKYSRLVMSANKDGEVPVADSCALDEGEEPDDDVVYAQRPTLLRKLRAIANKEEEGSESLQMNSSQSEQWTLG
uniref:Si:dkey-153k10.9 n=1 Tax=Sphaeramia orbicularis TaxID=375764 RepID=A0A673BBS9_9TELE